MNTIKNETQEPFQEGHTKVPGMAVQALAGEIIAALLADEKEGYDLPAGLFGPEFSKLVRRWAKAEWALLSSSQASQQKPVAWWKQHRDGTVELNQYETFIAEDALATGRRPLVFGDVDPPPARNWVGLSTDEIIEIVEAADNFGSMSLAQLYVSIAMARAIEAKLKKKNYD